MSKASGLLQIRYPANTLPGKTISALKEDSNINASGYVRNLIWQDRGHNFLIQNYYSIDDVLYYLAQNIGYFNGKLESLNMLHSRLIEQQKNFTPALIIPNSNKSYLH